MSNPVYSYCLPHSGSGRTIITTTGYEPTKILGSDKYQTHPVPGNEIFQLAAMRFYFYF